MLRLEKQSKSIAIVLHGKESFFKSNLMLGFSIALGLHFFAFLTVNIHSLFFSESNKLQPIEILAELPANSCSEALLEPEMQYPELKALFTLTPEQVTLKEWNHVEPLFDIFQQPKTHARLFESLEEYREINAQVNNDTFLQKAINVNVYSENLASRLLTQEWPFQAPSAEPNDIVLTYEIQVDDRTGKICWYRLKGEYKVTSFHAIGEKCIQKAQFTNLNNGFITTGEMEVVIHAGGLS